MTNSIEGDDAAIERLSSSPPEDWRAAVVDLALDTAKWASSTATATAWAQAAPASDTDGRAR